MVSFPDIGVADSQFYLLFQNLSERWLARTATELLYFTGYTFDVACVVTCALGNKLHDKMVQMKIRTIENTDVCIFLAPLHKK